jgi:hypothetical protein
MWQRRGRRRNDDARQLQLLAGVRRGSVAEGGAMIDVFLFILVLGAMALAVGVDLGVLVGWLVRTWR